MVSQSQTLHFSVVCTFTFTKICQIFAVCLQGEEFKLDPMLEDQDALMERINSWNFQIFDLVDRTGGKTGRILSYVSTTIINYHH